MAPKRIGPYPDAASADVGNIDTTIIRNNAENLSLAQLYGGLTVTNLKRAMLFLGVVAGLSQRAIGIDIREPRELMMISEYTEIGSAVRDLNQLSEVRKIILVDALRDMLADNRQLRLEGYVFRAGEPDLRVVAGRAEWFIDQVLLLPRVADNSVPKINERIDMWKARTASGRTLTPEQIGKLRTKYAGKIRTGIVHEKAFEYIRNLENFLDEWFPYGKSLQEMEQILDLSLPVKGREAILSIDSGLVGQEYRFLLDQGTIRVVKRRLGS